MSAAPEIARAATAADSAGRPPAVRGPDAVAAAAPSAAMRLGNEWLSRAGWAISRTGRLGLVGVALLLTAAVFLLSTYLPMAAEVESLRADLAAAQQGQARPAAAERADDLAGAIRALPPRAEVPAILRQLFNKATQARLAVDTGKYEVNATGNGGVVRYQIALPISGPYPQIRAFIDGTLGTMPAVGLSDLSLDRKTIADGSVEADIRVTIYTTATGGTPPAGAAEARPGSDRVVSASHAAALFAQHSWYVLPKAPPPAPPPPPPEPTAPPLPYTCIGSLTPDGHPPVYFLSRGDRVIDAHVGDRLDGVYQFESVTGGQLVFVYLPLNIRQTLPVGASK